MQSCVVAQTIKAKRLDLDEPTTTTIYQPPEEFPVGRWGEFQRLAKQLLPMLEMLSQSEEDAAHELHLASQQLAKSAPQMLSFECSYASKEGVPCRLRIQFNGLHFAVITCKWNKLRAGFQCGPEQCHFFTNDDAVTSARCL